MIVHALIIIFFGVAVGADQLSGKCLFPSHKDETVAMQKLIDTELVGKNFTTFGNNFNFTVGICIDVDPRNDGKVSTECNAVLQQKNGEESRVLGRCNNTDLHYGSDWVMLTYGDGDSYPNACGKSARRTMVMISCNCTAGNGYLTYNLEDLNREACYYLLEIDTPHVCPANFCDATPPSPTPSPIIPGMPPQLHGLSGGSIFLIIFFSIFGAYFIIGFFVKFCTGHFGLELIPNVYFWMSFFNLVADGCDFVFRCGPYIHRSSLQIDGEYGGFRGGHEPMSSSVHRRGPLTPPPSALPPSTPSMSETSSGYQNFNSLPKNQRPISTTGSLTGEAGSLTSTSDDTYLIQA